MLFIAPWTSLHLEFWVMVVHLWNVIFRNFSLEFPRTDDRSCVFFFRWMNCKLNVLTISFLASQLLREPSVPKYHATRSTKNYEILGFIAQTGPWHQALKRASGFKITPCFKSGAKKINVFGFEMRFWSQNRCPPAFVIGNIIVFLFQTSVKALPFNASIKNKKCE